VNTKSGVRTTEFWVTAVVNVLLLILPLVQSKLPQDDSLKALIAGAVIAGLNTCCYTFSRGWAKKGAQDAALQNQLAQVLGPLAGAPAAGITQGLSQSPAASGERPPSGPAR